MATSSAAASKSGSLERLLGEDLAAHIKPEIIAQLTLSAGSKGCVFLPIERIFTIQIYTRA